MSVFTSAVDVSRGIERMPIRLASSSNEELADASDFVYTLCNIPGPSISRDAFGEQYEGCHCEDIASCEKNCTCISRYQGSFGEVGDANEVVKDSYQKPIFECNNSCRCSIKCNNRVVQAGVKVNLEIFKTLDRGFGLRTLEDIRKDSFVCEYAGEVLTFEEAKQRSQLQDGSGLYYILTVREHIANEKVITTYIDPMYIGNVGRFINHSCSPNLYMLPVRVNNNIPRVGLFALEDIGAGEELSFHYSGSLCHESTEKEKWMSGKTRSVCHCGSPQCSGYLPYDDSLFG